MYVDVYSENTRFSMPAFARGENSKEHQDLLGNASYNKDDKLLIPMKSGINSLDLQYLHQQHFFGPSFNPSRSINSGNLGWNETFGMNFLPREIKVEPVTSHQQMTQEKMSPEHILLENSSAKADAAPVVVEIKVEPIDYSEDTNPEWILPETVANLPQQEMDRGKTLRIPVKTELNYMDTHVENFNEQQQNPWGNECCNKDTNPHEAEERWNQWRKYQTQEQIALKRLRGAEQKRLRRARLTPEQLAEKRAIAAERQRRRRAFETPDQATKRRLYEAEQQRRRRAMQTPEQVAKRRSAQAEQKRRKRALQTPEEAAQRRLYEAEQQRRRRAMQTPEQVTKRRLAQAEQQRRRRALESPEEASKRRVAQAEQQRRRRSLETPEQAAKRKITQAEQQRYRRAIQIEEQAALEQQRWWRACQIPENINL